MIEYDAGDPCPRRLCRGTLALAAQESTVPRFAFTYQRCPRCGWDNWAQRHPE